MNNCQDRKHDGTALVNPMREPYFIALGYDHSEYFFLQHSTGRVVIIDMKKHSSRRALRLLMLGLAPDKYWRAKYPARPGLSTRLLALSGLFRQCEVAGLYNPEAPRSAASPVEGVA